jgi:hypothetical protein
MPNERDQYAVINDLSGGQNDTSSEINLADNEARKIRNMDLHVDGSARKRGGATVVNSSPSGASDECNLVFDFKPTAGTQHYVTALGDTLYKVDGVTLTALLSGLDPDAIWLPVANRNLLYLQNNVDVPLVYAPHLSAPKVFRAGTPTPPTATHDSDIAGSIPAGDIVIRVRYISAIDDSFVGEPSPEFTHTMVGGPPSGVRISIPVHTPGAAPDHRVAKRQIERTVPDGGIFYIDQIVHDNTTTLVDLTSTDAVLTSGDIAPLASYREITPTLYPWTRYQNRMVGANPAVLGQIEFSEIDEFGILPEAFSSTWYTHQLDIGDDKDAPVACLRMGEYLIWYCGRSIHLMSIDLNGNSYSRRLGGHELGIPSARGVIEIPDGHLVLTFKGLVLVTKNYLVSHVGERIEKLWEELPKANLNESYMVHRYDKRQIKVVLPGRTSGSTKNDMAILYHYRRSTATPEGFPTRHGWTFHDGFFAKSGMVSRDPVTQLDTELSGDYSGQLWAESVGNADPRFAGGRIVTEYMTGWRDLDAPMLVKDIDDIWVVMGDATVGKLRVDWASDFGKGPSGGADMEVATDLPRWDEAEWDIDIWPALSSQILHTKAGEHGVNLYGRYIRLTFTQPEAEQTTPYSILAVIMRWKPSRDRDDGSS